MKTSSAVLSASMAALVAAAPTKTQNKRTTVSECAQYASTTASPYVVNNDLWGEDNGSGSQCYTYDGVTDETIEWGTTWSWADNADDVKSYANVIVDFTATKLSEISSLTSTWEWSYTGEDIVADVSYDLFTNSDASTTNEEYEIMIWLGRYGGAGPIASSYSASGEPESIASTTVGGHTFDLYKGSNGVQSATYSFVATENVTSFSADIKEFLTYLIEKESFSESQYLVSIGAGTEAFTGTDAVFKTSGYKITVDTGSSKSTESSVSSVSSSAVASATSAVAASSSAAVATSSSAPAYTSSAVVASSSAPAATSAAPSPTHKSSPSSGPSQGCDVEYVYA